MGWTKKLLDAIQTLWLGGKRLTEIGGRGTLARHIAYVS